MQIGEKKKRVVIRKMPVKPGELIPVTVPLKITIPEKEPAAVPAVPKEQPNVGTTGY